MKKKKKIADQREEALTSQKICYLCRGTSISQLFNKSDYHVYQCSRCLLQFTEIKKPYPQFVTEFYQKAYFAGDRRRNAYADYEGDKKIIIKNFQAKLTKIKKIVPQGRILDVGCATGVFLKLAKHNGYLIAGVEPSRYAFNLARNRLGNSVKLGMIENVNFDHEFFDLITLFDVFEHLGDPLFDLKKMHGWLKKDGYLIISTGDADSLAAKVLGRNWHFYNPPQHLFFWSKRTIKMVLNKSGFAVAKIEKGGKLFSLRYLLHLARSIYANPLADLFYRKIAHHLIGELPVYLNFNDTMTIYAVKKN